MGMFDDVTCEYQLPDGVAVPHSGFQTKSLECALTRYKITDGGELWELLFDLVPDDPAAVDALRPYKRENDRWERVADFRGDIVFYDSIDGVWHEYSALFDDGKLLSIKALPDAR